MSEPSTSRRKTIAELAEDTIWIYEHWDDLCTEYPKQVIGVHFKTVVAVAQSFGHLNAELRAKGLHPSEVSKAHMDTDPDRL